MECNMQERPRSLVGIVDDDAAVRDSLRFLLEAAGFRVVAYPSAEGFLTASRDDKCGCLLLDQHMPIATGLDLLRRLRDAGCDLPVAIMTGSPSAQLTRRAIELGAVTVLEKPLTEQALFQFLEDAAG
jgi:two-component system response regulator FixJ